MRVFTRLNGEVTGYLENFRQWVMSDRVKTALEASVAKKGSPHVTSGRADEPCSVGYLMSLNHSAHVGFPVHMHGIDVNYRVLQKDPSRVDHSLFGEIRERDNILDDQLQTYLGAKLCALKAYYPEHGHIGWHNNWNAPGYNIIFTYSAGGNGYWRHIEPKPTSGLTPEPKDLVHIDDVPGWHCKVGYFGAKSELDRVVWHCAYTEEPRLTVSYVIGDRNLWESMVTDISGGEG